MCKCGNNRCTGYYLLHPKEMNCIPEIKKKELEKNTDYTFKLIESPGNLYVKFMELHVLEKE